MWWHKPPVSPPQPWGLELKFSTLPRVLRVGFQPRCWRGVSLDCNTRFLQLQRSGRHLGPLVKCGSTSPGVFFPWKWLLHKVTSYSWLMIVVVEIVVLEPCLVFFELMWCCSSFMSCFRPWILFLQCLSSFFVLRKDRREQKWDTGQRKKTSNDNEGTKYIQDQTRVKWKKRREARQIQLQQQEKMKG